MFLVIRYKEDSIKNGWIAECIQNGPSSVEFTALVEWVTTELAAFVGLDDHVSTIKGEIIIL
jgi:hypothetical protein